jgi:hypothetical protein
MRREVVLVGAVDWFHIRFSLDVGDERSDSLLRLMFMDVTHVLWGMRQLRHDFWILEIGHPVDADSSSRLSDAWSSHAIKRVTCLSYSKMMVNGKKSRLFRLINTRAKRGCADIVRLCARYLSQWIDSRTRKFWKCLAVNKYPAHRLGYEEERSSWKQYLRLVDEVRWCKWNVRIYSSGGHGGRCTRQKSCNGSSTGKIKSKCAKFQMVRVLVSTKSSPATFVMVKGANRKSYDVCDLWNGVQQRWPNQHSLPKSHDQSCVALPGCCGRGLECSKSSHRETLAVGA